MTRLVLALGAMAAGLFSNQAIAASANASASAQVVTAISISNTAGLNFGRFAKGTASDIIVVSTGGIRTNAGTAVLQTGIAATAAAFTVGGDSGLTYSATVTQNATAALTTAGLILSALTIKCGSVEEASASATKTCTFAGVTDALKIGGSLTVPTTAVAGGLISDSAAISVSVDYN